ncbi:MAG: HIT family protein [Prevotellaceae bacterium]|jgi:histidine triad (HIT) family protein|nr:HIT family protein [Prevotellaceae bacterium]
MASIFTKIVQGEIPCYKIAEDDRFIAFLDIRPLQWGHTLVVPKREVDYLFDLSPKEVGDLFIFAQRVAQAIKKAIPCNRVGVAVLGLEVPHAHIHLVPLNKENDINFSTSRCTLTQWEFVHISELIINAFHS